MLDQIIITIYLIAILIVGIWAGRNTKTVSDYAIADKSYSTPILAATLLATIVGGGHTVGYVSKVFNIGIVYVLATAAGSMVNYLIAARLFAKHITAFKDMYTIADLMEHFYGKTGKYFTSVLSIIMALGAVGAQVLAIGYLLNTIMEIPIAISVLTSGIIITIYSAVGGVRAVTITDVLQFAILIITIPLICNISINQIGGVSELLKQVPVSNLNILHRDDFWSYVCLFFLFIIPDTAPSVVQRYLMAKDPKQLQYSLYAAAFLEIPFGLIVAGIGLVGLVVFPNIDGGSILPTIIKETLPVGIKGFAIAGMLAVIMSTADSILNTGGIIAIKNLYPLKNLPKSKHLKLMKLATIIIGGGSICIALINKDVIDIILCVTGLLNSTISIPLIAGIIGVRAKEKAFLYATIAGVISFVLFDNYTPTNYLYAGYLASIAINAAVFFGVHFFSHVKLNDTQNSTRIIFHEFYQKLSSFSLVATIKKVARFVSNFSRLRVEYYGAEHILFSLFVGVNYLVPFFMWSYTEPQFYTVALSIRIITGMLCALILLKDFWPVGLKENLFPWLWHITILLYLPFNTTFMFIAEHGSPLWLVNSALAVFAMVVLVDWLSFLVILPLGVFSAYLMMVWLYGKQALSLPSGSISYILYIISYSMVFVFLFTRRKSASNEDKLASMRLVGASIAHEMRTYITSLYGVESTFRDSVEGSAAKEHLNKLNRITHSLSTAVEMMIMKLNTGRMIVNESAPSVSMQWCINSALEEYPLSKSDKSIIDNYGEDFLFFGDNTLFKHVLFNLLKNSLKHTKIKPGSRIIIKTAVGKKDKNTLIFRDTGLGIRQEDQSKIFNAFSSGSLLGSGLGLAYCKRVISQMGGKLSLESKLGEFTEIIINLPKIILKG